jgi:hypothetical protein
MFHGVAMAISDINAIDVKSGEQGIITAYLPEDNIFAVLFSKDKWITFKENENEFLNKFNIIQE